MSPPPDRQSGPQEAYEPTSGSETRDARPVMGSLLAFSLRHEIDALRAEPQYAEGERNSRTLAKDVDFRVLLTVLRPGASLVEKDGDGRVSIHVLEGEADLRKSEDAVVLGAGDLAAVDRGDPWVLEARGEVAVLVTVAWPEDKAFV